MLGPSLIALAQALLPKFQILTVSGAVFQHFCPDNIGLREICQILRLSGQRVAVAHAGRKTHVWN